MCNMCDCEASDKCSIVGYHPIGACCSLCAYLTEEKSCSRPEAQEMKVAEKLELYMK